MYSYNVASIYVFKFNRIFFYFMPSGDAMLFTSAILFIWDEVPTMVETRWTVS